jgi:D-tyrosyl-tRNA(Tyr) deacylase
MRALIQRVSEARVVVDGATAGEIGHGLLALVAVQQGDDAAAVERLLHKLLHYRVFADDNGKMNLDLQQVSGGLLLVSQFTLAADTAKGLRPSFSSAAEPVLARSLYELLVERARASWAQTASGIFAADMKVQLVNDGPVTFLLEV